jgi:hypothetical protein
MHVDAVREAMHRQPFLPFLLRLADGRAVLVAHPDFIAVSPRRVFVINPVDESLSQLERVLIASIEFLAAPQHAPPTGDGAGAS